MKEADQPCVTISALRRWYDAGLLNHEAFHAAARVVRPAAEWHAWVQRVLLMVGSALILAGMMFFFAANWAAMGKFVKFVLIESGMAFCCLAAIWRGLGTSAGKVLLLCASVQVGILLAVYGQTYQTGADAYELFVGWLVLILGWTLLGNFAGLWFLLLVLANVGTILYWDQALSMSFPRRDDALLDMLLLALALLNGGALALREAGLRGGRVWLGGTWLRPVLLTALLTCVTWPILMMTSDWMWMPPHQSTAGWIAAWLAVVAGGYYCYRRIIRDMTALALIVADVCVVVLTHIGDRLSDSILMSHEASAFLLFGFLILVIVTMAALWLRKTGAQMAAEAGEAVQ